MMSMMGPMMGGMGGGGEEEPPPPEPQNDAFIQMLRLIQEAAQSDRAAIAPFVQQGAGSARRSY